MKLEHYLREHGKTASAFAAEIDVPASTITRLLGKERIPRLDLLIRIMNGTGGQVTPNDFAQEDAIEAAQ